MNFTPTQKRVLLKPIFEKKSPLLVYLEKDVRSDQYKVIKTGPDCVLVKNGDVVLIGKYSGDEMKLDGKPHILLKSEDGILAKVIDKK